MNKGVIEDKDLDAYLPSLADAVAHNIVDKPDVAATRYDNADAHTALRGAGKMVKHTARRHKVGGGEDYLLLGTIYNIVEQAQHSATSTRLRPIEHGAVCGALRGKCGVLSVGCKVIFEESAKLCHRATYDAQHGIVPRAELVAYDIAVCDVDATNEGYASIDNNHLAVVAAMAKRVNYAQLYALRKESLSQLSRHLARAVAIDNKAYTHTLARLASEQRGDGIAYSVAEEDVELHVDALLGALQLLD